MFEKRIVFSLPAMEHIASRPIPIVREAEPILADLYLPPNATTPAPIVIFIHGGIPEDLTPQPKDWGSFVSWGQLMAASGLAGVTFNHRMRWANGFVPGSIEKAAADLRDLIGYLRQHASQLNVDPKRICLFAFSAGGPMLAAPILEAYAGVRCLAAFYPFLGDTTAPDATEAARFSAIRALDARLGKLPPILVAKAGKDLPLLNDAIDAFVARARESGASIELASHPEGLHGFDTLNDDDTSRAIIRQAVEFIARHLSA